MPLLTEYQNAILESMKQYDFQRILRMKGKCHDALMGMWIDWWFGQKINGIICNPARGSMSSHRRCIADLLFLEQFQNEDYYEVKGVAEIENNEAKFNDKVSSLSSYEKYTKKGFNAYPDLEFAVFCYTLDTPNDVLANQVYDKVLEVSEGSELLWIVCEIGRSLTHGRPDYSIHMPNYVRGYDYFYYDRNFSSVIIYSIRKGKQIQDISVPGIN